MFKLFRYAHLIIYFESSPNNSLTTIHYSRASRSSMSFVKTYKPCLRRISTGEEIPSAFYSCPICGPMAARTRRRNTLGAMSHAPATSQEMLITPSLRLRHGSPRHACLNTLLPLAMSRSMPLSYISQAIQSKSLLLSTTSAGV